MKDKYLDLFLEINLSEIFNEIAVIIPQFEVLNYRIDFYLPEFNIAITYDENHSLSKIHLDNNIQKEIQQILKCDFVVVSKYCEINAINKILILILNKTLQWYEFTDELSVVGKKLLSSFDIKTYKELEEEKFIEILNKKKVL